MDIKEFLTAPVLKGNESFAWLNGGAVVTMAVGALALYLFIPEKRRKNLFN